MRAAIFCVLLAAVAISADLQSDIDDISSHLPLREIQIIGQRYLAADPKIRAALVYMQTLPYDQLVKDGLKVKEVHDLVEYLNSRGIDAERIIQHYIQMGLNFHRKLLEEPIEDDGTVPAITGNFIADIQEAVSKSEFTSFAAKKLETSPDFANFVAALRDPEFITLYQRVMNTKHSFVNAKNPHARGFFSKVWKKIKEFGVKVSVSIPFGK